MLEATRARNCHMDKGLIEVELILIQGLARDLNIGRVCNRVNDCRVVAGVITVATETSVYVMIEAVVL